MKKKVIKNKAKKNKTTKCKTRIKKKTIKAPVERPVKRIVKKTDECVTDKPRKMHGVMRNIINQTLGIDDNKKFDLSVFMLDTAWILSKYNVQFVFTAIAPKENNSADAMYLSTASADATLSLMSILTNKQKKIIEEGEEDRCLLHMAGPHPIFTIQYTEIHSFPENENEKEKEFVCREVDDSENQKNTGVTNG